VVLALGLFWHVRAAPPLFAQSIAHVHTVVAVSEPAPSDRPGAAPATRRGRWLDAAHTAWLSSGLAGVLLFARALSSGSLSIGDMAQRMAVAVSALAWGVLLAGVLALRASRLGHGEVDAPAAPARDRALGYGLLAALLVTAAAPLGARGGGPAGVSPWGLLLHWPAVLLVAGGGGVVLALAGEGSRPRWVQAAAAMAGTLGGMVGVVTALVGMARQDIGDVTSGIRLLLTSSFVAGLAMVLAAGFDEPAIETDGATRTQDATAARIAVLVFPLVVAMFLVIAFVLVITPMTRRL
jgi:hypothetical protein